MLSAGTAGNRLGVLCLSGLLAAAAAPATEPLQAHPERVSKAMLGASTRGGQLVVQQGPAGWRVVLGTRTVLDGEAFGAVRLRLSTVVTGRNSDLVVVVVNTRTACPVRFGVVSVDRSGHATVSQLFGSCADLLAFGVDGNALVFTMPGGSGADARNTAVRFRYAEGAVEGPLPP